MGANVANGTSGNDTLNGTAAGDTIHGLAGDDVIRGLDGSDVLTGGRGRDTIDGGNGNDVLVMQGAIDLAAGESYRGGAGMDMLKVEYNGNLDMSDVTIGADIEALGVYPLRTCKPARDRLAETPCRIGKKLD